MDNDIDSNGIQLCGEALNEFHSKKINEYFARIGHANLLGQVWETIEDPNHFSFLPDQFSVQIPDIGGLDQIDLSRLSPEQRAQVEKCLIQ